MGKRGPVPETAEMKRRKGNPGRRALPSPQDEREQALAAGGVGVAPPDWLSAGGREIWSRLAPKLMKLKLLQQWDVETFARYCHKFALWIEYHKKMSTEGYSYQVSTNHGEWVRLHPLFNAADRLDRTLQADEQKFGLNPADRQRIIAGAAALASPPPGDLFANDQMRPAGDGEMESRSPIGLLN